jgi:hypothetical protein
VRWGIRPITGLAKSGQITPVVRSSAELEEFDSDVVF